MTSNNSLPPLPPVVNSESDYEAAEEIALKYWISPEDVYIYVIYRLRGPDEKNWARGLENGPSPRDVFKTEGTVFLIRTEAAGK